MKRIWLICGVVFLVLFALLSKYEDRSAMRNLDFAVTVKVQERIDKSTHLRLSDVVGNVMTGATFFAGPEFATIAVLCLTGFALYERKKRMFHWKALVIPVGFILILFIELYGKSIVHHPSPAFGMIKHPSSVFPANYVNEQFSYPSGHAARAVYLAIISYVVVFMRLVAVKRKNMRIVLIAGLFAYVVLVGLSKISWAALVFGCIRWLIGRGKHGLFERSICPIAIFLIYSGLVGFSKSYGFN